jgi:hypothetical protein
VGLIGDDANRVGDTGRHLLPCTDARWMGARFDDYVDAHDLVAMVRTNRLMQPDASPRYSDRYVSAS